MSLPVDIEVCKNGQRGNENLLKKSRRNAKRRKPKNKPNGQENECDEKIREIINFLSNGITNPCPRKICVDNSSIGRNMSSINKGSRTQHWERYVSEDRANKPSTSDDILVPVMKDTRQTKLDCGEEKIVLSLSNLETVSNIEENLKKFLEKMKKSEPLCSKLSIPSDVACHSSETNQARKKCVMNKDVPISDMLGYETNENLLNNARSDKYSYKKSMTNKVKETRQKTFKKITLEKNKTASKKSNLNAVEFTGKSMVIVNSNFIGENLGLGKANYGESFKKDQSNTLNSSESKKKWYTDTRYPKYLTKEEIYSVSKFGLLLSGVIRINQKNFKEAYISAPDKGMDILIEGLIDRNRALEGDEVHYILKDEEHFRTNSDNKEIQRTAVVVAIKNLTHSRRAIGIVRLRDDNSRSAVLIPRDSRIPRILIKRKNWESWISKENNSFSKRLFVGEIKQWNDVRFAEGTLTKEIGFVGDIESETSAILLMLGLDATPHPDSLRLHLPKFPYVISNEDLAMRKDFRKECIFTIDPASAKDLDDAVSCKRLQNGNYQIGVHISDVTHFLHKGSPLDAAVAEKATTIYLVQKIYHMLPLELSELCSLTPGENKLAFSVLWEMTPDFKIVMYNFVRSVINSCGKFSYDQVQEILDGSKNPSLPEIYGGHTVQEVVDSLKLLNQIANYLRKQRFENGALRIDQTKITFSLDEFGFPINYEVYVNKEAHRLIEEFMLLANITVAEWISLYFPKVALLRSHSPPQLYLLEKIQKYLEKYGICLDISSSKSLHESLVKYSGSDLKSTARMMVLNTLIAKPMTRATYYCIGCRSKDDDKSHYALNLPLYTHFTSPIRRYADVMVHRLLAASLGYCKVPDWTPEQVKKIAENCNKKKYAAKIANEKSTELFLNLFTLEKGSLICQGAVYWIKQKFFDCVLLENGSHHRIYAENLKTIWSVENEDKNMKITILWPNEEGKEKFVQIIELFSIVKIELRKSKENKVKAFLLRSD